MTTRERPSRPSIAQLREITQPPAVRGRRTAEHWTGDVYMRRISPYVTRLLIPTGISANGVTWLMIISGWGAAAGLLVPGIAGPLLTVLGTQLQMMWDACDGEIARWRQTSSATGVFLDKFGHYTVETLIAGAWGVRAADGPSGVLHHLGWTTLGATLAWLLCLNKGLNDMVHASRAVAGLGRVPDTAAVSTPRTSLLARLRRAARLVPFFRIYHSVELSFLLLAVGIVDAMTKGIPGTRVALAVVVPLALLSVIGHFLAIVTSSRLSTE